MLLALARPLPRALPVFPYTAEGPWQDSQILATSTSQAVCSWERQWKALSW